MSIDYLDLSDYVAIAASVTGLDADTVIKVTDLGLADSALYAPAAGFGDTDFYRTSLTRRPCFSFGWRGTIRCPMATSVRHGWHCACSST